MSACLTYSDVLAGTLAETAILSGTSGTYYPAILTGYDVASAERDPSEGAAVAVTGFLMQKTITAPDMTIRQLIKFNLASLGLTFTPNALDRIEISGRSYLVTLVDVIQILGVVASYNLTLQS